MVAVADLDDLIRSHTAAGRSKDATITTRLRELQARIRDHGIQPAIEGPPSPAGGRDPLAATRELEIHAALQAASGLAVVFDDIRPALAAARRQLYHALDDAQYGQHAPLERRVEVARNAVDAALTDLVGLRRQLEPEATGRQLDEPPQWRGRSDSPALLAYQAHDQICTARRVLAEIDPRGPVTPEVRDLLIEARIHAATADATLDLLQIDLERTARSWELPDHGREIPGPEL